MAACFETELYEKVQMSQVEPEAKPIHHIEWHSKKTIFSSSSVKSIVASHDRNNWDILLQIPSQNSKVCYWHIVVGVGTCNTSQCII